MLHFQEQGILTTDGRLTEYAIKNSRLAMAENAVLKNPDVISILTRDGSRIEDWEKERPQPLICQITRSVKFIFIQIKSQGM
ncbi:MAG: hypothetical protein U1E78_05995 [Gammaproteobacteria bacterium]